MAPEDSRRQRHRKHTSKATRRNQEAESDEREEAGAVGSTQPQTVDELREARLAYLAQSPEERRGKMKFIGETVVKTEVTTSRAENRPRRRTAESSGRKTEPQRKRSHPARTHAEPDSDSEDEYVYGRPAPATAENAAISSSRVPTTKRAETARRSETRRPSSTHVTKRSQERRTTTRRKTEPAPRRNSIGIDERDNLDRKAAAETSRPPLRKSATTVSRDMRRPSLPQSPTAISKPKTEVNVSKSTVSLDLHKKNPSILSSFISPRAAPPEKKTSCLTCGDDAVPISRSAKLACSHRMCHTCLKRIFNMSVSDPAHMPPRCCTADHIPLKHVDKLFDQTFKKNWNRKFQEYTTRNRIYCPNRGCGEWIKPNHIETDKMGRKTGKCKRCGTRVCCVCNNKAHKSSECPKDPATKEFVEIAKQKGWQRCYSCSAMVELKEGCNHMTCRCTAEFCMVCGVRWKGCDCPWFNYENFDAVIDPRRAQEALDRRREQEQRDEELARRMEVLGVDGDDAGDDGFFGIGNAAHHHMNANFIQQAREALTANYQVAEQAARGLLNGMMTGRENRLPGLPLPPAQTTHLLRQPSRRAEPLQPPQPTPARDVPIIEIAPARPRRTGTQRRRSTAPTAAMAIDPNAPFDGRGQTANERAQDRRIQEWANRVDPTPN